MDNNSSVWANLPPDLLLNILARLPPLTFLRFRSVCKQWNNLPLDPCFSHLHSHFSHRRPGFLLTKAPVSTGSSVIYIDAFSGALHNVPLDLAHLPSDFVFSRASAAGLLCCSHGNCFYVCNPLSRTWKQLPPPSGVLEAAQVGLIHNPRTRSFQVLLVGWERTSTIAQLYDSFRNRWKEVPVPWGPPSIPPLLFFCNAEIFAIMDPFTRRVLVMFDPSNERWSRVKAPWPESCFACYLWSWQGHIMMVGLVAGVSLWVWQLEQDQSAWLQVTIISDYVSTEWKAIAGNDNFIYVILAGSSSGLLYDLEMKQVTWLHAHDGDDRITLMPFTTTLSGLV